MKVIVFILLFLPLTVHAWSFDKTKTLSKSELKQKLTKIQYQVTQEEGTERPFKNEYWDNKKPGIYVELIHGEPLFSSRDQYASGTGWPSFSKPLVKDNIIEREDPGIFGNRTEVRSRHADTHLGHVFKDGPEPTGLRYCMNSAALKFIPLEKMKEMGYGEFINDVITTSAVVAETQMAVFAGGCFWCMQPPFNKLKAEGVISTRVGYTGGQKDNPTYSEVSGGGTGHIEAIEVTFDPKKISYLKLLDIFWRNIDPFDGKGQFCDKGEQYKSAVFYLNDAQKSDFGKSLKAIEKKGIQVEKVTTALLPFKKFFAAEEYHQSYYQKNPIRYKFYRHNCGRDQRLKEVWGKGSHQ